MGAIILITCESSLDYSIVSMIYFKRLSQIESATSFLEACKEVYLLEESKGTEFYTKDFVSWLGKTFSEEIIILPFTEYNATESYYANRINGPAKHISLEKKSEESKE